MRRMGVSLLTLFLCAAAAFEAGAQGTITTIAGGPTLSGRNGGPAANLRLRFIRGVEVDSAGNVFGVDSGLNQVFKISPAGILTIVAGNGLRGFSGNEGPATSASLCIPQNVKVDASGNLYVADTDNNMIRRVSPSGVITTVAGYGAAGFSGDGSAATSAALLVPNDMTLDASGNLYIADTGNHRIRKVSANGIITTVAGDGAPRFFGDGGPATSASLLGPGGVAVDGAGNLYISDTFNHRIRKVGSDGTITTVAGNGTGGFSGDGGPAASASLNFPLRVAFDAAGNLFFPDAGNARVRKISPSGIITTAAGNGTPASTGDGGPAVSAAIAVPVGAAVDAAGNLYIAENGAGRIRQVNPGGTITTLTGAGPSKSTGDRGPAAAALLNFPRAVAVDAAGSIYIADSVNGLIRQVSAAGTITTVAGGGSAFPGEGGPATSAALFNPEGVVADASGNFYFSDADTFRIWKVNASGTITTVVGDGNPGFSGDGGPATNARVIFPGGLALDTAGNLYFADQYNHRVRKVTPAGVISTVAGTGAVGFPGGFGDGGPGTAAVLYAPAAVAVDAAGNLYISENLAQRIRKLTSGGIISTVAGNGVAGFSGDGGPAALASLNFPTGIALDASGNLYIADTNNHRIRKLSLNGTIATVAGIGVAGFSGDGGAATGASLSFPAGVAVDVGGNILIADTGNDRIRRISAGPPPVLVVSPGGLQFSAPAGSGALPGQNLTIVNGGQGAMSWTVVATTLSGGNWLRLSTGSGVSTAGAAQGAQVQALVNASGLAPGTYAAQIRVDAPGAQDTPQSATVHLLVTAAGTAAPPSVDPVGLVFTAQAGGTSPAAQTVRAGTASPSNVNVAVTVGTSEGGNWLAASPSSATINAATPGALSVRATLGTLAAGVFRGQLTLQFSDGSPAQVVSVLLVVTPAAGVAAAPLEPPDPRAAACVPQRLVGVLRSLSSNFNAAISWPTSLEVLVVDDCAGIPKNATVVASFSSGDPALTLNSLGNGTYVGTWRPLNMTAQVTVTVRATLPPLAALQIEVQGGANSNPDPNAPTVFPGGIVHGASFAAGKAVPPGGIISAFGKNMGASGAASALPLPTVLGGATMTIGGLDAPLFVSTSGQINAQLPFELPVNNRLPVVLKVQRGSGAAIAVPEIITITPLGPGIFTITQDGKGQGVVLDVQNRLVDAGAPATAGNVVVVYCTGLGATQPTVPSGQAAPSDTLARVQTPVTATVGGQPAPVQFAGMTPGLVGLYQVNVQIPAGVTPGPAVPLVLTQSGVPSNTVTLSVR